MKEVLSIRKLFVPEGKLRDAMELYPGKTREEVRDLLFREVAGKVSLGGCLAVFFLFFAIFAGGRKDTAEGILRADPGGMGKAVRLQIETQRGVQEIVVEVGAREYEPDRIEELHRVAEAYLEAVVPGENESFLRVTENLFFPDLYIFLKSSAIRTI